MSDFMNAVLIPNAGWLGTMSSLLLATVIYFAFRHRINFWVMDTRYVFPWVGKIAQLAKDSTQSAREGWLNGEKSLCADYKNFIHMMREPVFDNRIEYLKKAHDLGRTPVPLWVLLFLVVLVIAEGLGFSYMLGTWMAREGSANTHTVLMVAIVLVICGIMLWVTHAAGHQLYRTRLLRGCFKRFKDEGGRGFFQQTIALKNSQSEDDNEPDYTQCANRVSERPGDQGGYGWVITATVIALVIAFTATYMRWENLRGELSRETAMQAQQASAGNPFANGGIALPAEVMAPQKAADDKANNEVRDATKGEGLAAFIMLGFIFLVTQIVGGSAGYMYGFAGKESKNAYKEVQGFSTYDAYLAHYEPLIHLAESRLQALQQQLEEGSHQKLKLTKTFMDYLHENAEASNNLRRTMSQPVHAACVVAPAAVAVETPPEVIAVTNTTVEGALAQLDTMVSPASKVAFMKTLPADLQDKVTAAIKARKASEEEARDAELASLFS